MSLDDTTGLYGVELANISETGLPTTGSEGVNITFVKVHHALLT